MGDDRYAKQSDRERLKKEKAILKTAGAKRIIQDLVEHGHYEDVYKIYGSLAYRRNIPKEYLKKEIDRLKTEGKLDQLQAKFGEKIYNKVLKDIKFQQIKAKRGWLAAIWATRFKKPIAITTVVTSASSAIIAPIYAYGVDEEIKQNEIIYQSEIKEYNDNNEEYAKEIRSLKLNDLETIMIVTEDMWKSIDGYGESNINAVGFYELDLQENGMGVCRNMASDVAKKLNAINPDYNARIINVKADDHGFKTADIDINILDENSTAQHAVLVRKAKELGYNVAAQIMGDHVVVLMDIIDNDGEGEEKITLAVCPTNRGIGIYHDGRITMFNDPQEAKDGLVEYDTKEISSWTTNRGMSETGEIIEDYANSFKSLKHPFDYYREKYGLFAQQKSLNSGRAKVLGKRDLETVRMADKAIEEADRIMAYRNKLAKEGKSIYEIQEALARLNKDVSERDKSEGRGSMDSSNSTKFEAPDGPDDEGISL